MPRHIFFFQLAVEVPNSGEISIYPPPLEESIPLDLYKQCLVQTPQADKQESQSLTHVVRFACQGSSWAMHSCFIIRYLHKREASILQRPLVPKLCSFWECCSNLVCLLHYIEDTPDGGGRSDEPEEELEVTADDLKALIEKSATSALQSFQVSTMQIDGIIYQMKCFFTTRLKCSRKSERLKTRFQIDCLNWRKTRKA